MYEETRNGALCNSDSFLSKNRLLVDNNVVNIKKIPGMSTGDFVRE